MNSKRVKQISEDIRCHIALLLVTKKLADPRLSMVIIQKVQVTPDLSIARITYTLGQNAINIENFTDISLVSKEKIIQCQKALVNASSYIRKTIGENLILRIVPKLEFFYDEGTEKSIRINEILNKIKQEEITNTNNGDFVI